MFCPRQLYLGSPSTSPPLLTWRQGLTQPKLTSHSLTKDLGLPVLLLAPHPIVLGLQVCVITPSSDLFHIGGGWLTLISHAPGLLCRGPLWVGESIIGAPLTAALVEKITHDVEETSDVSYTCQNRAGPTCTSGLTHQGTRFSPGSLPIP